MEQTVWPSRQRQRRSWSRGEASEGLVDRHREPGSRTHRAGHRGGAGFAKKQADHTKRQADAADEALTAVAESNDIARRALAESAAVVKSLVVA